MADVVNLHTPSNDFFERTDTLKRFYGDIRKFGVLTREEEDALGRTLKYGNEQEKKKAKEILISCNQRFVVAVAKRYSTNENLMDLISEGNIGLIEAVNTFDIDEAKKNGVRFFSYAVWLVRRQINNYNVNYGEIVKKTNNAKTYHILSKARNKFIQKEEREPSDDELFDILNSEYDAKLKSKYDIVSPNIMSIDKKFADGDDDNEFDSSVDLVYNYYSASKNDFVKKEENEYVSELVSSLLKGMKERDRKIILMRFGIGYDRPYTTSEIAEEVRMTPERIGQIYRESLIKLKKKYEDKIMRFQ